MNIQAIEQAIIERLREKIEGVAIEAYPDRPAEYKLLHAKGALLVRYLGANYSENEVIGYISQIRSMRFEVVIILKQLSGHEGMYEYIDNVLKALTGFRPCDRCEKMQAVSEEFVSEDYGVWTYAIEFMTRTVLTDEY